METSSSEVSTTSTESVRARMMTALGPNSAAASTAGAMTTPSSITTSTSTSDKSCHAPVLTEPNTATARTRTSP
jgi:hypothetical protein